MPVGIADSERGRATRGLARCRLILFGDGRPPPRCWRRRRRSRRTHAPWSLEGESIWNRMWVDVVWRVRPDFIGKL